MERLHAATHPEEQTGLCARVETNSVSGDTRLREAHLGFGWSNSGSSKIFLLLHHSESSNNRVVDLLINDRLCGCSCTWLGAFTTSACGPSDLSSTNKLFIQVLLLELCNFRSNRVTYYVHAASLPAPASTLPARCQRAVELAAS